MAPLNEPLLQLFRPGGMKWPPGLFAGPLEHPADVEPVVRALFNQPGTEIKRLRHAA